MTTFFRYPHTPHLAWLGAAPPRDDKVLPQAEASALLSGSMTVEEKLDGASLGISLGDQDRLRFQNRGQYLSAPYAAQFSRLNAWAGQHKDDLLPLLQPGLILFGEWLAARHSIGYGNLPDWFAAFDVYDGVAGRFWCLARRNAFLRKAGLSAAPVLAQGQTTLSSLVALVTDSSSRFGAEAVEGVVVRRDGEQFNEGRAKLVRPGFVQGINDHWSRRTLEWNRVRPV